ncbi:metacaspase-1-like [Silene latifolia]|uniref:metacaspase-1-like n=1 Tax=Silene latifolia TaxID=37657 RepID=UPI003D780EF7
MVSFVKCSKCRAESPIQPEANAIRCGYCHTITRVPDRGMTPHLRGGPIRPPSGRKKAVICGINYKGSGEDELNGCINDAKSMKNLLINRFKFPESNIMLLTDEEKDRRRIPTRDNIIKAMSWLVDGVRAGDSLVFHFAGHGMQEEDDDGDDADGFDEAICPLDVETEGGILDDEINDIIVKPIPPGAKLTAIIDACHSGTVLDLPFRCRILNRRGQYVWKDHRPKSLEWKGTNGGEVIAISGCADHQTSEEIKGFSKVIDNGAMTYCFIQAVEKGQATTYGNLFSTMKASIRNITQIDSQGNTTQLTQDLQLSSNERFDPYAKPFSL